MSEGDEMSGPRFDPTINLGHILSLSGIVFSVVAAWFSIDARLGAVERQMVRQTSAIEISIRQDEQIKQLYQAVNRFDAFMARSGNGSRAQ